MKNTLKSLCGDDVEVLYGLHTYDEPTSSKDKIPKNLLVPLVSSLREVYFEEAYEEASRLFRLICPTRNFSYLHPIVRRLMRQLVSRTSGMLWMWMTGLRGEEGGGEREEGFG